MNQRNDHPYIYLFVREDLTVPQKIIQVAHAVDHLQAPVDNNYMVLFTVPDEKSLHKISKRLLYDNIDHHMFFEPDINSHTAIATRPLRGEERTSMKGYRIMR